MRINHVADTIPTLVLGLLLLLWPQNLISSAQANPAAESGYRVVQDERGAFWFQSPTGERFLSMGVNNVDEYPHQPRAGSSFYDPIESVFGGDEGAWQASVVEIMGDAGLNTIGAWSSSLTNGIGPYETIILYAAGHDDDRCLFGLRSDFESVVRENITAALAEFPDRRRVMGYFLDNEARWYGGSPWTLVENMTLLEYAFDRVPSDDIHQRALEFLKRQHTTPAAFAKAWDISCKSWEEVSTAILRRSMTEAARRDRRAFIEYASDEWFRRASAVAREMLPMQLNLGVRFAGHAPEGVVRACGRYCDVLSLNDYRFGSSARPDERRIADMWIWGGKPILITEYSWRAAENQSGNPNTGGAGTVVQTQAERGRNNHEYLLYLLRYPMVVGAHWFEWADQSPQGRFDGENSNYGIVDIHHGRYEELISAMSAINRLAPTIHAQPWLVDPDSGASNEPVRFDPGQYPERPPLLDLLAQESVRPIEVWAGHDAGIHISSTNNVMVLDVTTGEESWGCGISVFGPLEYALDDEQSTNLDGYVELLLDATIPEHIVFKVYIDEATVGPSAGAFASPLGDDGESYSSELLFGRGERHTYRIPIGSLEMRTEWGNQSGNRRIDLHAAKGLAIYFPNAQGEAQLKLHRFGLQR